MAYIETEEEVDTPDDIGLEAWQEYERRKKALQGLELTPREYDQEIKELAKELGI